MSFIGLLPGFTLLNNEVEQDSGKLLLQYIFLTVLHRLFVSGSDRDCIRWQRGYKLEGVEELCLHHLYRAMFWLGEELDDQKDAIPFSPRCTKDLIEEELFLQRRDLFSNLDLVFFDTTSIYFEGDGGEAIGARGHSKDHRPDLKQMVVGVILDDIGYPICCLPDAGG